MSHRTSMSSQIALLVVYTTSVLAVAQNPQDSTSHSDAHKSLEEVHFTRASDCALCHSFAKSASAMRDSAGRNVAPFDLWSGSMMANSAVDPYWRAAVSAEVAATPAQKLHIEEVCTRCHAPMAAPIDSSPAGEVLAFLHSDMSNSKAAKAKLGRDGVSCTVCHQISAEQLGTEASFTGGFIFNKQSLIYGPHASPVTMPMQHHVGYTPAEGDHILSSAMCATCHTVITGSYDHQGASTGIQLHEQVPYLEWRNSIYNDEVIANQDTAKSCQACHMPRTDIDGEKISTRLAHNPGGRDFPFLRPREPYGRHTFAGGNTFMTQLIRDHRESLGLSTPAEAFESVIAESRKLLQTATARLSLSKVSVVDNVAVLSVGVENLSGHKFPTAYPSRRAWIEFRVRDSLGNVRFSSGRFNAQGQLVNSDDEVLETEKAHGPMQPHFETISDSTQVQIYESLMEDTEQALTFALLRGSRFKKDNRLLPKGWSPTHEHAAATQPRGTEKDSDFVAGKDRTTYQLQLTPGSYVVEARLLFQSLSGRYMAELFEVDTPEVKDFKKLYDQADRKPEVIASAEMTLAIP